MKNNRAFRRLCERLVLLLVLGSLFIPTYALSDAEIDRERLGSIELSCFYDKKPVSGGNLLLYQVATLEEDGGLYYYRLSAGLGGERLTQEALDRNSLAGELAAHEGLQWLSSREGTFGESGIVRFEHVSPGVYLLVQTKAAPGFACMEPVLVSVPFKDPKTGEYTYDVDASVKPAVQREVQSSPSPTPALTPKPDPGLPNTGQLNWPVPVLIGVGTLLVLLGLGLVASDFKRERQ